MVILILIYSDYLHGTKGSSPAGWPSTSRPFFAGSCRLKSSCSDQIVQRGTNWHSSLLSVSNTPRGFGVGQRQQVCTLSSAAIQGHTDSPCVTQIIKHVQMIRSHLLRYLSIPLDIKLFILYLLSRLEPPAYSQCVEYCTLVGGGGATTFPIAAISSWIPNCLF